MGSALSLSYQPPTSSTRMITADTAAAGKSPMKFPSTNSRLTCSRSVKFTLSPDSLFPANQSRHGSEASSSDAITPSGQFPFPLLDSPAQRFIPDVLASEAYDSIEKFFAAAKSRSPSPFTDSGFSPNMPPTVNKRVIAKSRRRAKEEKSLWKYYKRKRLHNQIPADVVPTKNS